MKINSNLEITLKKFINKQALYEFLNVTYPPSWTHAIASIIGTWLNPRKIASIIDMLTILKLEDHKNLMIPFSEKIPVSW